MNQIKVTSLSSKGQIVIPNEIRKIMGISEGTKLIILTDGTRMLLQPVQIPKAETFNNLIKKSGKLTSSDIKTNIVKHIVPTLKRNGATKIALFGSYAEGTAKKDSDIDILVKFSKIISLLDLSGLKIELEEKTNKKIDLLTYNSINPRLKPIILKQQKVIYEKRS